MKKLWIGIGVIVVIALAIFLITTQTPKEPKKIKIGAILPLTGPAAMYGNYAKEGIQLAIEDSQSKGKKIEVIFEDSRGAPGDAVSIAQKFVSSKDVPAILCLTTSETSAIAPILEKNKIVLITGTINPGAADLGEYVFRNATNLLLDAEKIIELCLKSNIKKVAIIGLIVDAHLKVEEFFKKNSRQKAV